MRSVPEIIREMLDWGPEAPKIESILVLGVSRAIWSLSPRSTWPLFLAFQTWRSEIKAAMARPPERVAAVKALMQLGLTFADVAEADRQLREEAEARANAG